MTAEPKPIVSETANKQGHNSSLGYKTFKLGDVEFSRDLYFCHLKWPTGSHSLHIEPFLRATLRMYQWQFFFGSLLYDDLVGFTNHYGTVELFIGRDDPGFQKAEKTHAVVMETGEALEDLCAMLENWSGGQFDPFVSPRETGRSIGAHSAPLDHLMTNRRLLAKRILGGKDEAAAWSASNGQNTNEHFEDLEQIQPLVHAEPGYEDALSAFNVFAHLACQEVVWNPSICSVVRHNAVCITTEEEELPVWHKNDRLEWFVQLSDEIIWDIQNGADGQKRARVIMRSGDVSAMPHDIRHRGKSPKRSMLLVWENSDPEIHKKVSAGAVPFLSESLDYAAQS